MPFPVDSAVEAAPRNKRVRSLQQAFFTVIQVENLSVRAGSFALDGVSFDVATGEYAILMGRTGSGKTTILESLCGLKAVVAGSISLMGRNVTHLKPAERGIGFVPQEGALFHTMKVRDQIGFALTIRKWKHKEINRRVQELAELLGIKEILDRSPVGLSGGERQRIALGRALAASPGVLCMDEPLSALDDHTREGMYSLLKTIQEQTGVTTLHITHSKSEAKQLGDVIFKLEDGGIHAVSLNGAPQKPEETDPPATPHLTPDPVESKSPAR